MHSSIPGTALAVALLLPASAALAQQAQPVELDAIQVTAPIATDTGTATRTDTPINEIPQSISIIPDRQLADRAVHGVEEAVWFTAGAQGGVYGSDSRSDWLLVRGFTPARYLDGLALAEGSSTSLTRIEPYGMQRIEVLKGPASVNYGAMPPGGLINYVSKRPTDYALREVELQVGSEEMRQLAFDFGGPLNDDASLTYRLTGLARNSDTSIDYIHDDRYFLAPALTWTPDDANTLTVLARYQAADTKAGAGFLPARGTLLPNPNGRISPSLYTGEPNANDYEKTLKSIGYEFRARPGDRLVAVAHGTVRAMGPVRGRRHRTGHGHRLRPARPRRRAARQDRRHQQRLDPAPVTENPSPPHSSVARMQRSEIRGTHSPDSGATRLHPGYACWFYASRTPSSSISFRSPRPAFTPGAFCPATSASRRPSRAGSSGFTLSSEHMEMTARKQSR